MKLVEGFRRAKDSRRPKKGLKNRALNAGKNLLFYKSDELNDKLLSFKIQIAVLAILSLCVYIYSEVTKEDKDSLFNWFFSDGNYPVIIFVVIIIWAFPSKISK